MIRRVEYHPYESGTTPSPPQRAHDTWPRTSSGAALMASSKPQAVVMPAQTGITVRTDT